MLRLMKIFEVLWLIASIIALTEAIIKFRNGEAYGNYIYITIFTACVAGFMYYYKKKHRKYMEAYYRKKEEEAKQQQQQKPKN